MSERYWVIAESALTEALSRVRDGESPAMVLADMDCDSESQTVPDAAERERERWADAMELERREWREGPQTPDARIAVSLLGEWMNRLRFNEPAGSAA